MAASFSSSSPYQLGEGGSQRHRTPLRFYFQVNCMQPDPRFTERRCDGGWNLPQHYGSNVLCGDNTTTTGAWFVYDTGRVGRFPGQHPGGVPFRVSSFYHDDRRVWIYPADATLNQVGEVEVLSNYGRRHPTRAKFDQQTYGESEESLVDPTEHWLELKFNYNQRDPNISQATIRGQHTTLSPQRHYEQWVSQVLPRRYHAAPSPRNTYPGHCGLTGNLDILIALIAFSVRPEHVEETLRSSMRDVYRPHAQPVGQGCEYRQPPSLRTRTMLIEIQGLRSEESSCASTICRLNVWETGFFRQIVSE